MSTSPVGYMRQLEWQHEREMPNKRGLIGVLIEQYECQGFVMIQDYLTRMMPTRIAHLIIIL